MVTARGAIAVEEVRAGDRLGGAEVLWCRTRHLDAVAVARRPAVAPVRITAGALGPGRPARELRLAPGQMIATDLGAVPAEHLADGGAISREDAGAVAYVTLGLRHADRFDVSGLACLTIAAAASPRAAVALRRHLAPGSAALRSSLEVASQARVVGWALDEADPAARVAVEISIDGTPIAWAIADQRRPDLEMAGLGDGACAFEINFDPPPETGHGRVIEVRRAGDGRHLTGSPILLLASADLAPSSTAPSLAEAVNEAINEAIADARGGAAQAGVATTLLRGIDAAIVTAGLRAPFGGGPST